MRILVACEMSGVVRDAFIAMGHDAISCDLLPSMRPGPHYHGDIAMVIQDGWDMMIAFRPVLTLPSVAHGTLHRRGRTEGSSGQ